MGQGKRVYFDGRRREPDPERWYNIVKDHELQRKRLSKTAFAQETARSCDHFRIVFWIGKAMGKGEIDL